MYIEHIEPPNPDWDKIVRQGLYQHNREKVGSRHFHELSVVLRDEQGQVRGGLVGGSIWGWFLIEALWVDPALRRQGYGQQLLTKAEEVALSRGCTHAILETFTFQALPLYQKQGYVIYGQLDGFPAGHTRYSLKKELAATNPELTPLNRQKVKTEPHVLQSLYQLPPTEATPQSDYLEVLHQITLDLLNHRGLEDLLQLIVERAAVILDAPYAEIMLLEGDELVVRAFTHNQPYLLGDVVRRGEALITWRAFDTRQPVLIDDYFAWSGRRVLYDEAQLQAVGDFPIVIGQTCLGVLAMARVKPDYPFGPEEVRRGMQFSQLAALVLEHARLYDTALREIEERERIQAELAQARDQALQASQYKTELIAKVSHELRTPLNVILGYTEYLHNNTATPLTSTQKEFTAQILSSTLDLDGLISDLLDESEIERSQMRIQKNLFYVRDMVNQLCVALNSSAKAKGLTFSIEVAPELPDLLLGDQKRLRQILINLVNNAIKFTEVGLVAVHIGLAGPKHWLMQVTDTGPGISGEAQDKIFDAFWQVDGSATRKQKGYGLGLSIVKQLTALMGGEISLKSEVGQGSSFTVLLPLETQPEIQRSGEDSHD